jgi:hypothetical protein
MRGAALLPLGQHVAQWQAVQHERHHRPHRLALAQHRRELLGQCIDRQPVGRALQRTVRARHRLDAARDRSSQPLRHRLAARRDQMLHRLGAPLVHAQHRVDDHEKEQQHRDQHRRRSDERHDGPGTAGPRRCIARPVQLAQVEKEDATAEHHAEQSALDDGAGEGKSGLGAGADERWLVDGFR